MNKENKIKIVFTILLLVALAMGVVLVQQTQELRKGAYFAETTILLQPTEIQKNVGEDFGVQVWVNTGGDAKVDGLQTDLCYKSSLITPRNSGGVVAVEPNSEAGFSSVELALVIGETDDKCFRIGVRSSADAEQLKSGMVKVATVYFTSVSQGAGEINMRLDKAKVSGDNPDGSDKYMKVNSVAGMSYSIVGGGGSDTPQPTSPATDADMWINYRVAFAGVKPDRQCATGWQTKLTALSGQIRKEYTSVPLTRTTDVNDKGEAVYEGSFHAPGFSQANGVALFFKGPKHLQVKYGKSGQTAVYNQAGGEISLTNVASTSPVLDFSEYPILAGDVNGDGMINGIDFTTIKPKAADFVEIASGGYLAEDLDGSCQVNNNDIILLVRSLNEKQDQVY